MKKKWLPTLKIEKATDWGYQPFLGLTYALSDRALLGVVYRAEMDVELEGDVKVRNLNLPISADSIDIDWDNPQWLEAGLNCMFPVEIRAGNDPIHW